MQQTFACGGKQIRVDVLGPQTSGVNRRPALILLHGSGGNVGFWLSRLEPALAEAGILLFAPHYFDRTDTLRADLATITDGVHVPLWLETLEASLAYVGRQPGVDAGRIALAGISLGAFLSMSWAAMRSAQVDTSRSSWRAPLPRCIVEVSGGLPESYASQATRLLPPTLVLHGEQDTVVPIREAHRLDELLTRLGVVHEMHILKGEGHWFSSAAQWQLLVPVSSFLGRYLE